MENVNRRERYESQKKKNTKKEKKTNTPDGFDCTQ